MENQPQNLSHVYLLPKTSLFFSQYWNCESIISLLLFIYALMSLTNESQLISMVIYDYGSLWQIPTRHIVFISYLNWTTAITLTGPHDDAYRKCDVYGLAQAQRFNHWPMDMLTSLPENLCIIVHKLLFLVKFSGIMALKFWGAWCIL